MIVFCQTELKTHVCFRQAVRTVYCILKNKSFVADKTFFQKKTPLISAICTSVSGVFAFMYPYFTGFCFKQAEKSFGSQNFNSRVYKKFISNYLHGDWSVAEVLDE